MVDDIGMTNTTFYILCNAAAGLASTHETLEAALDAVNEKVGQNDDWVVHELNSQRFGVIRVKEGHGHIVRSPNAAADVLASRRVRTGVRATCETCGDIGLFASEVTVRYCDDTTQQAYRFRCPICSVWTIKDTAPDVAALLIRSGAAVEHWRLPLELDERPEHGASINYDDMIDFHEALDRLPTALR